jgi:anti-anti-sigma factor
MSKNYGHNSQVLKQFQQDPVVIDIEQQNDVCVLRCRGRFVAGRYVGYMHAKMEEIKRLQCRSVVADFCEVPSIGSTGINFIVGLHTWVNRKPGGRFVLAGAGPFIQRVLDLTRLSAVLPMTEDLPSGLTALRGAARMANSKATAY